MHDVMWMDICVCMELNHWSPKRMFQPVHNDETSLKKPVPKPGREKSWLSQWFSSSKSSQTSTIDPGTSKARLSPHNPAANTEHSEYVRQRSFCYSQTGADMLKAMLSTLHPVPAHQRRNTWIKEPQEPVFATEQTKNRNTSNLDGYVKSNEKPFTFDDPSKEESERPSTEFAEVIYQDEYYIIVVMIIVI